MRFYRSLATIKAITFDLDDTLYDNSTVVELAESHSLAAMQHYEPLHDINITAFYHAKKQVLALQPDVYHDVIAWRIETIKFLLQPYQLPATTVMTIVDTAMEVFTTWRHKILVPQASFELLAKLNQKYPLAVITNGNVDINCIGLADYFQFSLRGGADGRSKPFADIFTLASQTLSLPPQQILHVGDSLYADVNGAVTSGMQSCWINNFNQDIKQQSEARCLPHIEITQLPELNNLL